MAGAERGLPEAAAVNYPVDHVRTGVPIQIGTPVPDEDVTIRPWQAAG